MIDQLDIIRNSFPFSKPREGQIEAIDTIMNSFQTKKFFILDAPTGTGKSVIGTGLARAIGSSYYITAQKLLQDQLTKDFGEFGLFPGTSPLIDLKGRNAYECTYYKEYIPNANNTKEERARLAKMATEYVDCSKGECKRDGKSKLKFCDDRGICQYLNQLRKAVNSRHTLMNFHSFIFQTEHTNLWNSRDLLIIDEAHNTEQVLLDYISLTISDVGFAEPFPEFKNAEEYLIYFEEIELMNYIKNKIIDAVKTNNDKEEEYWTRQGFKYKKFKEALSSDDTWVAKFESKSITNNKKINTVELKPLYIRNFTNLIFDYADNILLMSATIMNSEIFADTLGIKKEDYTYLALPNKFPKENRKIHFIPSGSMNFRTKTATLPKMLKDIEDILEIHENDKGIIHTHNFEITKYIVNNINPKHSGRILSQLSIDNKSELLKQHAAHQNSVIVAPAFHEGLDLKEDLSRFQIICKIPYPSFVENPQLTMRMKLSSDYYQYITALKLVQSYGRSIRSETDTAETYVLDLDFKSFVERSRHILPEWFTEAIRWR